MLGAATASGRTLERSDLCDEKPWRKLGQGLEKVGDAVLFAEVGTRVRCELEVGIVRTALAVLLSLIGSGHLAHAQTASAAQPDSAKAPPESLLRGGPRLVGFYASSFGGDTGDGALGWGLAADLGLQRIPITVGVDVMTAYWGSSTSRMQVRAGNVLVPVDRTRDDISYFLDTSLRLQPIGWLLRPYLEGFVGAKLLKTRYSLSFPDSGSSTSTDSEHDWASTIGWGAGLDLGTAQVSLTIGFRRVSGSEASFSRAASANGDAIVQYTAPTSCMMYMLGLTSTFGVASSARQ